MKTKQIIVFKILFMLLFVGCEATNDIKQGTDSTEQISFTSTTRGGSGDLDEYGSPYSEHNLIKVPDTVGAFVRKTGGILPNGLIMKNVIYRLTKHKSGNFLLEGDIYPDYRTEDDTPNANEEQLFWYKTTHPAAYWDKDVSASYDIYAYAPAIENGTENDYYTITNNGKISFKIDERIGIPVDFIYSKREACTISKADSLHMPFQHKLSKIVFKLKNDTENAVTCYGVKYKIKYPTASFDLIEDKWEFSGATTEAEIKRYAQYEIFSEEEVTLSNLTTLLFPTHTDNTTSGTPPGNVIFDFQVCLNNKWYDMKTELNNLNLQFTEGKLIELTFNCNLTYGDGDTHWNVFVATFDSFEEGGTINGELK